MGISTNARMLIHGFIERLRSPGIGAPISGCGPTLSRLASVKRIRQWPNCRTRLTGLRAPSDALPQRSRRLREMRDLLAYMENAVSGRPGAIQPAKPRGRLMSNLAI